MATINQRGPFQFQAQVRRKHYPTQTKTFETRREAKAWVSVIESKMVRSVFTDRTEAERTTLGEALDRYMREVTPGKRSTKQEINRIKAWKRQPLALRSLASLRGCDFAVYRDVRLRELGLQDVGSNAVRLELAVVSHLFTIARKEWSLPLENPIKLITMPKIPKPRSRRLVGSEENRLFEAFRTGKHGVFLAAAVELAIETGMREGELATLQWSQVLFDSRLARLELTKNNDARDVPLSRRAVEILKGLPRAIGGKVLFAFSSGDALSKAFGEVRDKLGLEDLHFHDLRHEAASRLAPYMPAQTLAKVMGWKTIQMAMRYYNPTGEELLRVIDQASQRRGEDIK